MIIKQQKGSFLLEFLIALGIFSIAIVGLVKLQNRSIADLSDLGSDMAIPILIDDFTARINLIQRADTSTVPSLSTTEQTELIATGKALLKTVSVNGATITITDMIDTNKKNDYTVVLDDSNVIPALPAGS